MHWNNEIGIKDLVEILNTRIGEIENTSAYE